MSEKVPFNIQFGKNVRYYREQREMTIEQLAEFTNSDEKYMNRIEMGLHSPTSIKIEAIAQVLNISVNDLFEGTGRYTIAIPQEEIEKRMKDSRMRFNRRRRKQNSTKEKDK